jgi:hypothetical protein
MKKIFGCFLLVISMMAASGQIIYVETGKMISSFRYKDSNGNSLDDLKGSNQNNLGLGLRMPMFQSNFHISGGASYNRYGSKGSDPVLGNYYEWDVTYLGANLGFDYEFFKPESNYTEQHGFSFCLKISTAAEFLLNGTQNLNNQLYDLKGVEEFDKPLYFVRGGVSVNYYISRTYVVFAEYMGGTSFLIGDYNNKEQLRFVTHNISVGFAINLFYRK